MKHYVLDFVPPLQGMDDHFNTIRLGLHGQRNLPLVIECISKIQKLK